MDNVKGDAYYFQKIIKDASFIIEHTKDLSKREFENNEVLVDSALFRLIQISENANKLSDDFKSQNSAVPWKAIKDYAIELFMNTEMLI